MATVITELNTVPGKLEDDWVLNVTVTDASGGIDLCTATTDYRHGIKSIIITANEDEWVAVLNGDEPLIGPVNLEKGTPWPYDFAKTIYCNRGNALRFKTESAFAVHLFIEGDTGAPVSSMSASPSASPSEGS